MLNRLLLLLSDRVTVLEALLQDHNKWVIDLPPADKHPLNLVKMQQYLAACDSEIRTSMSIVLQNIQHISYDDFLNTVHQNIEWVLSRLPVPKRWFFFVVYTDKSPIWVSMLIMRYISEKHKDKGIEMFFIKTLNDMRIKEDDLVIFADDCAYSGLEFVSVFHNAFFEYKHPSTLIKVLLFLPYISDDAYSMIQKGCKHHCVSSKTQSILFCDLSKNVPTLPYTKLPEEQQVLIGNYFPNKACNVLGKHMVYFDHKIADCASIPEKIFQGVVACSRNRDIFENNQGFDTDKIIRIQFIDNLNRFHEIDPPYKTKTFYAAFHDIWQHMDQYSWT